MMALMLTEGGQKIGFGHITRCRALADALNKVGFEVTFVVRGDSSVRHFFYGQTDHFFDWTKDSARLNRLLVDAGVVIIDSYLAVRHFYEKISNLPVLSVFVDDYMRLNYPQGILVNGGIGTEKFNYPNLGPYPCLLGSKYGLVRKEFLQIRRRALKRNVRDVLVTFGGMKRGRFAMGFLRWLAGSFPDSRFHVVLSSRTDLEQSLSTSNLKFYFGLSAIRMRDLMLRCDAAVTGGGQTTNELCCCGIPMIGIRFANNQKLNLRGWEKSGVLLPVGDWKDKRLFQRIAARLSGMTYAKRILMSRRARKLVDGWGALRTAMIIKKFHLQLFPAKKNDSVRIFRWANDEKTRAMSFNTERIRWEDHQKWFAAQLKRRDIEFFLAYLGRKRIGSVRFKKNQFHATISITIAPRFRGQGLGARLIRAASALMFERFSLRRIDAFIKSENKISKKIFWQAGFRLLRRVRIMGQQAEHWVMKKT